MDDVRRIQNKLAELDREAQRLLDAYQAGLIPLEQLRRRQDLLDQRRAHVTRGLAALQHQEAAAHQQARLRVTLERFTRSVCQALGLPSFEHCQHLLRTVVSHVMVEAGRIDIHFAIRFPDPLEGERGEAHGKVSTLSRLRSTIVTR